MSRNLLYLTFFILVALTTSIEADTLSGLPDITVVDDEILSLRYEGTEYVVANGDLALGTTTRWFVSAGVENVWIEGDPAPTATVIGTSSPKIGDVGSRADNFLFRSDENNNISSIDGIDFQQTVFPFLTDTFFLLERGGNESGTWQAIYEDGSLGPEVPFDAGDVYADTGVNVGGQNAFGVVFKTDVPALGVRINSSGHDTLSISTPMQVQLKATNPDPVDGAIHENTWVKISWSPGNLAASHDVYFGDNFDDVSSGAGDTFQGNQTLTQFFAGFPLVPFPNGLVPGNKYYWRIDEVDSDGIVIQKGDVWNFEPSETIIDPDLAGWWKLDDGRDITAFDSSGQNNHGVLINGPGWINAQWVLGYDGSALEFDGIDDYVDIPYPFVPASYTFSAWVRPAKNGSASIAAYTSDLGPTINWSHQLRINESGKFEYYVWPNPDSSITGMTTVIPGTWYSVAVAETDNVEARLYVNGEEEGIALDMGTLPADGDRFLIGSNSGDGIGWFEGTLDDLRIYNRSLSQDEIDELLNITNTTETAFYYNGPDEQVPITIALDRFGAIANEGVTGQEIGAFIEFLNLVPLEIIEPGGIIILGLESTLDRQSLVQLARDIRITPGSPFARTGLIVTPGEATAPMILTDEIIAEFLPEIPQEDIDTLNAENSVTNLRENPFAQNQFLLTVTGDFNALDIANLYHESPITEYALPNFILIHEPRLNDEFFNNQWHLDNTGQNNGTADADIDAPEAWKMAKGEDVVIAIIDLGFDVSHRFGLKS